MNIRRSNLIGARSRKQDVLLPENRPSYRRIPHLCANGRTEGVLVRQRNIQEVEMPDFIVAVRIPNERRRNSGVGRDNRRLPTARQHVGNQTFIPFSHTYPA